MTQTKEVSTSQLRAWSDVTLLCTVTSFAVAVAASELGRPIWPGTYQKTTHLPVQGHLAQNLDNKDNYGVYEKQVILPKLTLNERKSLV
jgi:hypothetical protein